jgi:hypothetical protein
VSQVSTYAFGTWVDLEVETSDPHARRFFAEEFGTGAASTVSAARRIHLRWDRSAAMGAVVPGRVRHIHKLLARWDYRASTHEGVVQLEARGNRWALPMVHHMLVLPTLRRLAAETGTLMLHGAAVARSGKSIVFTGRGGAGKTTLASILLSRGAGAWRPMSDDYTFLGPAGRSHGFLTRSHLYQDLLGWAPELARRLTPAERRQLRVFGWIRSLSRDGLKWPVRIPASRLWPGVEPSVEAELAAFFLLRRTRDLRPEVRKVTDLEAASVSLLAMNFHEARHHIELLRGTVWEGFGEDWIREWREGEARLLRARMAEAPSYWLDLPMSPDSRDAFASEVEDLILPLVDAH